MLQTNFPTERHGLDIDKAVVYDCETLPNCFLLNAQGLYSDLDIIFEISEYRNDAELLYRWCLYWQANQIPMIGFNNLYFDYQILHQFFLNPYLTPELIFQIANSLIRQGGRFSSIYASDRFTPQIDLLKIHHFDNRAKSTSLKALQVNMRLDSVMEMPIAYDQPVTPEQIKTLLIPYNRHDVASTKQFTLISMEAIKFRLGLMDTVRGDVMNWSDTKIGGKLLEQRLGPDLCYDAFSRQPRQTPRQTIPLADIIFPYIRFEHPEFQRILDWMRTQTLTANEITESIQTKGVFTGVKATVGGLDFHFGTGGIHGSVTAQRFETCNEYVICDIDVASLYPSIAIVNRLYPEHLGERFVEEYAKLPAERKEWQKKKGKKCVEANSLKLAANGTYGNSNNAFSVFYDPKFTMSITINGQLLLCMLAERLLTVPTLQIIQINTDGITFRVHPTLRVYAQHEQAQWEKYTRLVLEELTYSRMWIRDVNSYIAEDLDGKLKLKGAYWYPAKFPDDISNAQPPAWHKDLSALVVIRAAVEHITEGTDIERFIYSHHDPFDFMCRAKVDRSSKLYIDETEVQRITRYYVALNGDNMRKVSPPAGPVGEFKRKNGISDYEWSQRPQDGSWSEAHHTKNRSRYVQRETAIEAGYKVAECNLASRFDFGNVNYQWYIDAARKLVI